VQVVLVEVIALATRASPGLRSRPAEKPELDDEQMSGYECETNCSLHDRSATIHEHDARRSAAWRANKIILANYLQQAATAYSI
jgi:hypothetical protein